MLLVFLRGYERRFATTLSVQPPKVHTESFRGKTSVSDASCFEIGTKFQATPIKKSLGSS